jgi:hypothetical protein
MSPKMSAATKCDETSSGGEPANNEPIKPSRSAPPVNPTGSPLRNRPAPETGRQGIGINTQGIRLTMAMPPIYSQAIQFHVTLGIPSMRFSRLTLSCCSAGLALTLCANLAAASAPASVPTEFVVSYDDGFSTGFTIGYDAGFDVGTARGTSEGTTKGRDTGYQTGWDETYYPAYTAAYTMQYPLGYNAGVPRGLQSGFDEGVAWAETVAQTTSGIAWLNNTYGSVTLSANFSSTNCIGCGGGYGSSTGTLSITLTGSWQTDYDWAGHYYDLGFGDGKKSGTAEGTTAGYDAAFPAAYEAAYDIAYPLGLDAGGPAGTADGGDDGFNEGWDAGFDDGYYVGFDAGAEYFVTHELSLPQEFSFAAAELNVPEPSTLGLLGLSFVALWRTPRRLPSAL